MFRLGCHKAALAALGLFLVADSGPSRAETIFDAPFDPATCGDRLNRLYDGNFDQFWNYIQRQGYTGAAEYAWSAPERDGETAEEWRKRARQCLLEVERANQRDDTVAMRHALGYFLWFGTSSSGFAKEPDGSPGVRERGYRMLHSAATEGNEKAAEAMIQVYLEMVQLADQKVAYAARNGAANPDIPDWWPPRDKVLTALDRMAKTRYPSAFLAISSIYSERALLPGATGHDHNGNQTSEADPRLVEASRAYRKAWLDNRRAAAETGDKS